MKKIAVLLAFVAGLGTIQAADIGMAWDPDTSDKTTHYQAGRRGVGETHDPGDPARSTAFLPKEEVCSDTDSDGILDECRFKWVDIPEDAGLQYFTVWALNEVDFVDGPNRSEASTEIWKNFSPPEPPTNYRRIRVDTFTSVIIEGSTVTAQVHGLRVEEQ